LQARFRKLDITDERRAGTHECKKKGHPHGQPL